MSWTLGVGIALDILTAAFALYAAWRVRNASRRGVPVRDTLPFWYGLAGFLLLDGGYALVVLATHVPAPIPLLVLMTRRLLFLVGTGALVLALLRMARQDRMRPYALAYYAVLITVIEALTWWENPTSHVELPWSIQFVYSNAMPAAGNLSFGIAIFAPLVVASTLALLRYGRQATREQRFRLVAFTTSVQSFCVGVVVGFWDNDWFWYGLFENRLAFAIVAGMLFALRPPWLAIRFGITRPTTVEKWPV